MKERFNHYQFAKDVYSNTDKELQKHYSEKGGHLARHEHHHAKNKNQEVVVFQSETTFEKAVREYQTEWPNIEKRNREGRSKTSSPKPKDEVWAAQKWCYEQRKRDIRKERHGSSS